MIHRSVIVTFILLLSSHSWAELCPKGAHISSDNEELSINLRYQLQLIGIDQREPSQCNMLTVNASQSGEGIFIAAMDENGHPLQRRVSSERVAATVIASWLEPYESFDPTINVSPQTQIDTRKREKSSSQFGGISLLAEYGLDSHSQRWLSVSLGMCVQVGRFCIGGLARGGRGRTSDKNLGRNIDSTFLTETTGFDILATIALPFRLSRFVISPELEAGFGLMTFHWRDQTPFSPPRESRAQGVRLGSKLGISTPIGGGYFLDINTSAEILPAYSLKYDTAGISPSKTFDFNALFRFSLGLRH